MSLVPLPIAPVEPDVAATPVAVRVDPVGVLGAVADDNRYWELPPNTLVFHKPTAGRATYTGHKRRLTTPDPPSVCAYYEKEKSLIPFGVSIDGTLSAEDTRRWPVERGMTTVSVSGTVTMVVHMDDVRNIDVGDRLCIGDGEHTEGMVGFPGLQMPQIVKFDGQREQRLREIAAEEPFDPQKYRAENYFGVCLEVGYAELRVLLTP